VKIAEVHEEVRFAWAWLNPLDPDLIEERADCFLVGQFNPAREPQMQNVLGRFVLASRELFGRHRRSISRATSQG